MSFSELRLRNVVEGDLAIFFDHHRDREARHMAAFTSEDGDDEEGFMAHWNRIRIDASVLMKTIQLPSGNVAGSVGSYADTELGAHAVTYWVGKNYWGKGVASRALGLFLEIQSERPLYARLAKDNIRSLRVLEKHNFRVVSEDMGFAAARGTQVEELLMQLGQE